MDFETKLEKLKSLAAAPPPLLPNLPDKSFMELKVIETQLNKHLKDKQGQKFKKVSVFNFNGKYNYDEQSFNDIISKEISDKYSTKKWPALPICIKWKLVEAFLLQENINDQKIHEDLKKLILQKKETTIHYDQKEQKITSIDGLQSGQ
jgi:hypothetical protein